MTINEPDKILKILHQYNYDNIRIYIIKTAEENFCSEPNNNYYDLTNNKKYIDNILINLTNLTNFKDIKTMQYTINREHYYSQIRDIDVKRKREKCYVIEEKQLNKLNLNNIDFIINFFDLYTQDLETFPNLHKYHNVSDIERTEYIFDNIKLVFENNNIFIDLKKKYNNDELKKILNIISLT